MAQQRPRTNYEQFFRRDEAVKVDEAVHIDENDDPLCSLDIEDQDLPFIPAEIVGSKDGNKGSKLWIVIDDIVYDCSDFTRVHPGGDNVIQNFGGQNCSWQFWRIHSRRHLKEFGIALRVGKTRGVGNRFKEPNRYIRLQALNEADW